MVIDSEIELERIASAAGSQDRVQAVRLRVNSGVHAHTHEYLATAREDQKFGIAINDVASMVEKIRSHKHLEFLGLHSHIGSQIFAVECSANRCQWVFKWNHRWIYPDRYSLRLGLGCGNLFANG